MPPSRFSPETTQCASRHVTMRRSLRQATDHGHFDHMGFPLDDPPILSWIARIVCVELMGD